MMSIEEYEARLKDQWWMTCDPVYLVAAWLIMGCIAMLIDLETAPGIFALLVCFAGTAGAIKGLRSLVEE